MAPATVGGETYRGGKRGEGKNKIVLLIGHTNSFTVGGETEGAHGPLGGKRP